VQFSFVSIARIVSDGSSEPDLDQLFDDMKPEAAERLLNQEVDHELPGMGQHYCVPCGYVFARSLVRSIHRATNSQASLSLVRGQRRRRRYFISAEHLQEHEKSKLHKRRVKVLQQEPYRGPDEKIDNGPRLNRAPVPTALAAPATSTTSTSSTSSSSGTTTDSMVS